MGKGTDVCGFYATGNVVRDAELKIVGAKETPLATFSIAVNQGYGDNEHTSFFNMQMWGVKAEKLAQYLVKGKKVVVSGEPKQERWDTDAGKRSKVVVTVLNITLVSTGDNSGNRTVDPASTGNDNIPF